MKIEIEGDTNSRIYAIRINREVNRKDIYKWIFYDSRAEAFDDYLEMCGDDDSHVSIVSGSASRSGLISDDYLLTMRDVDASEILTYARKKLQEND